MLGQLHVNKDGMFSSFLLQLVFGDPDELPQV